MAKWLVVGFISVMAVVGMTVAITWTADWVIRLAGWLRRDRVSPLLEDCDHEYTLNEDETYEWCQKCDSVRPTLLALPPERTWEQMTSHQLPIIEPRPTPADLAMDRYLAARERRVPWHEIQERAAYESLGLEFPSGLVARVRELTP